MRNVIAGLLLGVFVVAQGGASAQSAGSGQSTGSGPIRVLYAVGGSHDYINLPPILEARLVKEGGFQVTWLKPPVKKRSLEHLEALATVSRQQYDVILMYAGDDNTLQMPPAIQQGIERFLEAGGGLVVQHNSSRSYVESPGWLRIIGGRALHHRDGGPHDVSVTIVDRNHPITAGVDDFKGFDEEHCIGLVGQDVTIHVLARFTARHPESPCPDSPNEMMWTREYGRGRVFHFTLGHSTESWNHPAIQQLYVQGIRWAAGRK